jgi:hypothetical protein
MREVFSILTEYIARRDWREAFETVIPSRKFKDEGRKRGKGKKTGEAGGAEGEGVQAGEGGEEGKGEHDVGGGGGGGEESGDSEDEDAGKECEDGLLAAQAAVDADDSGVADAEAGGGDGNERGAAEREVNVVADEEEALNG